MLYMCIHKGSLIIDATTTTNKLRHRRHDNKTHRTYVAPKRRRCIAAAPSALSDRSCTAGISELASLPVCGVYRGHRACASAVPRAVVAHRRPPPHRRTHRTYESCPLVAEASPVEAQWPRTNDIRHRTCRRRRR